VLAVARSATGGKCDGFLKSRARQVQRLVMPHADSAEACQSVSEGVAEAVTSRAPAAMLRDYNFQPAIRTGQRANVKLRDSTVIVLRRKPCSSAFAKFAEPRRYAKACCNPADGVERLHCCGPTLATSAVGGRQGCELKVCYSAARGESRQDASDNLCQVHRA
jgi:hypothetical protein